MSTYVPSWVKRDPTRFPRAKIGRTCGSEPMVTDALSVFHTASRDADAKAFASLMSHIRGFDSGFNTVIMVQVENEVGLLGDSRDRSEAAELAFAGAVPSELLSVLSENAKQLHPDLKAAFPCCNFAKLDGIKARKWEDVFGTGANTNQLFMAYYFAKYVDFIAAAGKKEYPIPMYTNAWLNYNEEVKDSSAPPVAGGGNQPGDFPSGGPTSTVLDIWQTFAPSLDIISPDIYLNNYENTCEKYRHRNQTLFIPEQRRDAYGARRSWVAYGSYAALGSSPFGIDTVNSTENPFKKTFGLLSLVSPFVLRAQEQPNSSVGFCFDEVREADHRAGSEEIVRSFGEYMLTIERCFVFGKPGPAEGMIIHQAAGRFLLVGFGFQVRARALDPKAIFTGILSFEEKAADVKNPGLLRTVRSLNGDETRSGQFAMMPNEDPDYGGFPISVTIPARTMIAELQLYHLTNVAP